MKTFLRQGKNIPHRLGGGGGGEKAVQTPRSEKKEKEELHSTRAGIHRAACGRDHTGAVCSFMKELQPMENPIWSTGKV